MTMWRRFFGLFGILAFAAVALTAQPAYAQDDPNARAEYELRLISNWAQSVVALNSRGMMLLQSTDRINDAIERFAAGSLDEPGLDREVAAWRAQFDAEVAQLRTEYAALPPPPRLTLLASLQPGLDAVSVRSVQGLDQVESFGRDIANLFAGVATGEIDSGSAMHQSAMRMLRELFAFENGSLAIMRAMSPPEHPNQNIAGSRIAFNNSIIVFFDVYLVSMQRGSVTLTAEQREQIRAGAVIMREQNALGRAITTREQANMDLYGHTMTPAMRAAMTRLLAGLHETFGTLDRAAAFLDRGAAVRSGANLTQLDALLSEVTTIAEELDAQNTARASALAGPASPEL